jgi:hypothetical protein
MTTQDRESPHLGANFSQKAAAPGKSSLIHRTRETQLETGRPPTFPL